MFALRNVPRSARLGLPKHARTAQYFCYDEVPHDRRSIQILRRHLQVIVAILGVMAGVLLALALTLL
jgi:hypothetical protein